MGKGEDWERESAKIISLWWSGGIDDDLIWRTSGSGSRATTRRKQNKRTVNAVGDLCYTDRSCKALFDFMVIECKRGYANGKPSESINTLYWIDRPANTKPPLLYRWWKKLDEERRAAGAMYQCIIFRRTGKRPAIMISWTMFCLLENYCNQYTGATLTLSIPPNGDKGTWQEFIIADLEHFLDWVSPETIELILEDRSVVKPAPKPQKRQLR